MEELVNIDSSIFSVQNIRNISYGEEYTYDLQVQDDHHYILDNGIVSHNSSIFAGQVSNGIQPVFSRQYTRWVVMTDAQKFDLQIRDQQIWNETVMDSHYLPIPNPLLGEWYENRTFRFATRGNQQILRGQIDGITYQIDKSRGLVKPMEVTDYGWAYVSQHTQYADEYIGEKYEWCATTDVLTVDDHLNMLAASAKYINQNQSKTINIPAEFTYEDFKNVYMNAWRRKIKGITTYRAGTMTAVLEDKKAQQNYQSQLQKLFSQNAQAIILSDVKIPQKSYALQYKIKDKNKKKWYFTLSFADRELTRPFALFIRTNQRESNEVTDLVIQAMEQLLLSYGIREQLIQEQRDKYAGQSNVDKIGRAIGMALRHNIPMNEVVQTLQQHSDGLSTLMFHIRKVLGQYIKDGTKINDKLCDVCGEDALVYQAGCSTCISCGASKCS